MSVQLAMNVLLGLAPVTVFLVTLAHFEADIGAVLVADARSQSKLCMLECEAGVKPPHAHGV